MASSYTTGTINQPDAGSVGQAMVERIRDDVVAHAAWELVEEFTPSASPVRWYVLKCLGSANGLGADFFVIIGRTLSDGRLRISICDTYDSGGHVMSGFPVDVVSGNLFDALGRHPATWTLGTNVFSDGGQQNQPAAHSWSPAGTSTKWWLIVTEDTLSVAFNGPSIGFFHAGAYTFLGQITNDLPLQIIAHSRDKGYLTRNPAIANLTVSNSYSTSMRFIGGGAQGGQYNGVWLGFPGYWQYNDKLQNNQRPVAEIGMVMDAAGSTDFPTVYGYALGKQKRMRWSDKASPAGFAFGDAYALNGTLWVPFQPGDGRIWDTGVASS